jgi:hypothetical protein
MQQFPATEASFFNSKFLFQTNKGFSDQREILENRQVIDEASEEFHSTLPEPLRGLRKMRL